MSTNTKRPAWEHPTEYITTQLSPAPPGYLVAWDLGGGVYATKPVLYFALTESRTFTLRSEELDTFLFSMTLSEKRKYCTDLGSVVYPVIYERGLYSRSLYVITEGDEATNYLGMFDAEAWAEYQREHAAPVVTA
jgi:hypothetical protein